MRSGGSLLLAVAAAVLAAACAARGSGTGHLDVRGPAYALSGFDLELEVRPLGALARHDVSLTVLLNGNELGRFGTEHLVAHITLPADRLRPGTNRVMVKSGDSRRSLELRVVPAWQAGLVVALFAALGLALARRRGRRRPGAV